VPCKRRWADGRGREGGLTLPVETTSQAVHPVGQTNSHNSPYCKQIFSGVVWDPKPPY